MTRAALVIFCAMIVLGAAQGALAARISVGEIAPDFLIVATVVIGLLLGPVAGTLAGALAGLVHGSVAGMGLGSFMFSRTLVGYLAGVGRTRVFSDNPFVPLIWCAVGTLAAELLFILFSPPAHLVVWLAPLPLIALYNAILALPINWALKRLLAARPERPGPRPYIARDRGR